MRFIIPLLVFVPGYWLSISDRGFGGLWALFLSPLALIVALATGVLVRKKLRIQSGLHMVDFAGVLLVLLVAWWAVPVIR